MGGFGQLFAEGPTIMPPLDLPYLAGYLESKGVPLTVIEAQGLGLTAADLAGRIAESLAAQGNQRALAVFRTAAPTLEADLAACSLAKQATDKIAVAVYGAVVPHVRKRLESEENLEFIVEGEPDETVHELVTGTPLNEIEGLSYRVEGQWMSNRPRAFAKDLDRLPFPKWELLPYQRYTIPRSSTAGHLAFLPMLTSRGCPFGCHYCPYPVGQGLRWRFRTPKNVVDEMEHLVNDLGIRYVIFRDPMFSLRLDRVVEICEEINRRGLQVEWQCETRPDCLNEETIRAMASAGCKQINFGVESAEVEIQANVGRKPISRETIIERTACCHKHGIKTFCFFIIGLPGDTVETILETISFAIRLNANWVQFTAATPFIGTKLHDWAVEHNLVCDDDYAYISSHEATVGNENLSKEQVETLHRFAKRFERYLLNRRGILKDTSRTGFLYKGARSVADFGCGVGARAVFAVGSRRLVTRMPVPADMQSL
jgi:radical SAM superfamily enzyme YgiQ (UPF0313 family)